MQTRDVPAEQWKRFLDSFTQLHRGDPMDVETVGGGVGPRSELCARPLVGVVSIPDCGQGACIEVIAGADAGAQTHTIRRPSHLIVAESDDGMPVAVQITAEDGSVTSLRFESSNQTTQPPGNYLG